MLTSIDISYYSAQVREKAAKMYTAYATALGLHEHTWDKLSSEQQLQWFRVAKCHQPSKLNRYMP